ncbi:hypothetical protein ES703_74725 [subsurface metagenome]
MTAKTSFTFEGKSSIWTSSRAINTGAIRQTAPVIAIRLFEAANPAMIAAIQNRHSPISMAVKRYENLELKKQHRNQRTNENINIVDIDKLYTVLVKLVG